MAPASPSCIFNLSLCSGIIPDDFKKSCITPIYKGSGSKSEPSNYRPISVVITIAKYLEKIIKASGNALSWFKSYLNNQKQYLLQNDNNSRTTSVSMGVPQGTILGQILFLIYSSDFPSVKWFHNYICGLHMLMLMM